MTLPFLPRQIEHTLEETTYRLDARPAQLAVGFALLALMLLVALVVLTLRRRESLLSPFIPLLIGSALGGLAFLALTTFAFERNGVRSAAAIFHETVRLDRAVIAIDFGVAIAAVLIFSLRKRGHLLMLPIALPCVVACGTLLVAEEHARSIRAVGELPFFAIEGSKELHVGHDRDVAIDLYGPGRSWSFLFLSHRCDPCKLDEAARTYWSAPTTVHVHASKAGDNEITSTASRGPITLETRLHLFGRREVASPLLSLRVGDRFTYRVRARSTDGALLYFVTMKGGESAGTLTLEIKGTRERNGFRTFVLAIHREQQAVRGVVDDDDDVEIELVAIDGTTRYYDLEHAAPGDEAISFGGDTSSPDPVACRFALLSADALCQRGGREADVPAKSEPEGPKKKRGADKSATAKPPIAFAAAAPASFEQHTTSTAGSLVTAFFALATAGLLILPDGSSSRSFTLVATTRGPQGAPEALPEATPN